MSHQIQILVHSRDGGVAQVRAVQEGHDVQGGEERDEAKVDLAQDAAGLLVVVVGEVVLVDAGMAVVVALLDALFDVLDVILDLLVAEHRAPLAGHGGRRGRASAE